MTKYLINPTGNKYILERISNLIWKYIETNNISIDDVSNLCHIDKLIMQNILLCQLDLTVSMICKIENGLDIKLIDLK